ncbi:hypothetical protein AgCh_034794 [Apium graveolens]
MPVCPSISCSLIDHLALSSALAIASFSLTPLLLCIGFEDGRGNKVIVYQLVTPKSRPLDLRALQVGIRVSGSADPIEAMTWLKEIEKAFALTKARENQKTEFASYFLQEEASYWWNQVPFIVSGKIGADCSEETGEKQYRFQKGSERPLRNAERPRRDGKSDLLFETPDSV